MYYLLSIMYYVSYLHKQVEMNGLLLAFGGNTHKDTAMSYGAKCFSSDFMVYDVDCGRWHTLPAPEMTLKHDVSRFGHSAVVHKNKDRIKVRTMRLPKILKSDGQVNRRTNGWR